MIFPWQQSSWQHLLARVSNNTLPHALLLSGPQGIGKTQFARYFANRLLCQSNNDTPCGSCRGCQWFGADTHPDFLDVSPLEGKSRLSINQIREMVGQLTQTASASGYQVVLINPAESMTTAAANALLKTLEEPLGQVVLLLVSSHASSLPATILSRCQRVKLPTPSLEEAQAWLQANLDDPAKAPALLALSEGLPLLAKGYEAMDLSLLTTLLGQIDPIALAQAWQKSQPECLLQVLISLTMDMLRCKLTATTTYCRHQTLTLAIQQRAELWSSHRLFDYLRELQQDLGLLQRQANPNVQLLLEKGLMTWNHPSNS